MNTRSHPKPVRQSTPHTEMDVITLEEKSVRLSLSDPVSVYSDHNSFRFDFSWIDPLSRFGPLIFETLGNLLRTHSPSYAYRSMLTMRMLYAETGPFDQDGSISVVQVETVIEKFHNSYWPFIQAWMRRTIDIGQTEIFEGDLRVFLGQPQKFETNTNPAYFALLVNDPNHGAFTEQELKNIQDELDRVFEIGRLKLKHYALAWMLIGTGCRPVQLSRFKLKDVIVSDGPEGKEITLYVPLAKGEKKAQHEKWKRRAPSVLAEILVKYLDFRNSEGAQPDDPLFRSIAAIRYGTIFGKLETWSERTRSPIHMFPYRFRYTLGTRALAQGASDFEVARLLTHRTTSCVAYYRAAMPSVQKPINDALAGEMKFFAKMFKGKLIGDLHEATRKDDAGALIRDFANLVGQPLGACGTNAICHQNAPVACLTCRKFEPFRDAPWEQFLRVLEEDLEIETEVRIKQITLDAVVATKQIIEHRDLEWEI